MSFHKSNLGAFNSGLNADVDGYVPDAETGPWDLIYDHGTERTHDDDGTLTEYGEWWEEERFPEIRDAAIAAAAAAQAGVTEWVTKESK